VEAAADPLDGDAPLRVRFSARAIDPDGPESGITYLWDFDDGGANAFGRNARHTYMEPGTYTATVTATDRDGAFETAEVTVEVGDPPGNLPPTVQAAATPRSGAAPLRVRFTSAATDPDGDRVSTVWDFGDGGQAGGPRATHTYTAPGSYTATVTVTDPSGSTDTDSVLITVTGAAGAGTGGQGLTPPSAVGGFPQADGSPTESQGGVQGEFARRLVRAPKSRSVRKLLRSGLRLRVTCLERCAVKSKLKLSGERLGKSKTVRIRADRTKTVVVKLDRAVRRSLLAGMRQAGIQRFKATTVTKIRSGGDERTIRRKVTLKR
jgi:phage baseplate assembly protein gpV